MPLSVDNKLSPDNHRTPTLVPRSGVLAETHPTINSILNRDTIANEIKENLLSFEENCKNINYKKGFYVYGSPGSGKTHFVTELLKELNYDVIKYDAGDLRNKSLIDTITSNNISNQNVLQMMSRTRKKIAIVMDEIDGMNNGDKGGITSLIKLIRQKKTKKQKAESMTLNPIICIGNYFVDKKIKELMKVCNTYELKTATPEQITQILDINLPLLDACIKPDIVKYVQGDMRKLAFVEEIYKKTIGQSVVLTVLRKIDNVYVERSVNTTIVQAR
jgi:Cdc6-like AAA superfamily ATPase